MNKTQKYAWSSLVGSFVLLLLWMYFYIMPFCLKKKEPSLWGFFLIMLFPILNLASGKFIDKKKQSLAEPDFDERDILIELNAIKHSFIAVCTFFLWPARLVFYSLVRKTPFWFLC